MKSAGFVELSKTVRSVAAGMSQVIGSLFNVFFAANAWNLSTSGVLLPGANNSRFRLFASLRFLLQDGAAHKGTWHNKGDAGSRFCMLCKNIFSESSKVVDADGSNMCV